MKVDVGIVAYNLRELFKEKKRQSTHSLYRLHPRFQKDDLWERIARLCIQQCMNPSDFIDAVFDYSGIDKKKIMPTLLQGAAAERACENWKKIRSEQESILHNQLGEDDKVDRKYTADELDIKVDIMYVLKRLQNRTGSTDMTPENLELLRARYFQAPAYVRILLAPHDEIIAARYQLEADGLLAHRPDMWAAMESLGLEPELLFNGKA